MPKKKTEKKEKKDESSKIDEKQLEKVGVKDQKNGNLEDHKVLIVNDRISVDDAHERDNKMYLYFRFDIIYNLINLFIFISIIFNLQEVPTLQGHLV